MPYCRYCHAQINKFDKDICPNCGGKHPIDVNYKTMDMTKNMKTMGEEFNPPKTRSQKCFVLLCAFLGYFGVHDFYIYKSKKGVVELLITLIIVGGIGSSLFFTALHNALAFIIPFAVIWAYYIVSSILYTKIESPKDGKGEFLR